MPIFVLAATLNGKNPRKWINPNWEAVHAVIIVML
jgi:hypothetical protein